MDNNNLPRHWEPTGRVIEITCRRREYRNRRTGETAWMGSLRTSADRSIPGETIRSAFRDLAVGSAQLGKEA